MVTTVMSSLRADSNSWGCGAAPPTRMELKRRSAWMPSSESSALCSCIGVSAVYMRSSVWASSSAARANSVMLKPWDRSRHSGSTPATNERTSTWMPAMWWAGMASSHWPGPPRKEWVASALATRLSGLSCAPFGVPVEPEVDTTKAMSSAIDSPARMWLRSNSVRVRSAAGRGKSVVCPAMAFSRSSKIPAGLRGSTGSGARI